MNYEIVAIISLIVLAIILYLIVIAITVYDRNIKAQTLKETYKKNDWLFSDFQSTIYNLCYKNASSDKICGISKSEYDRSCKLLHIKPNFEYLIALRIECVFIVFILLLQAYIFSMNIGVSIILLCACAVCFYAMWVYPYKKQQTAVDERLYRIQNDLPRFLSLLEKAMDLPVDKAMLVTASKFDSPLSVDIIDSLNKVSLGAGGWTDTLIDIAKLYKIEAFSELMVEIINSYEQGVNIRNLLNRKVYEVEQQRLYAVEAHDAKVKTLIFLPVMIFKVVPLMALICMPMIQDFV